MASTNMGEVTPTLQLTCCNWCTLTSAAWTSVHTAPSTLGWRVCGAAAHRCPMRRAGDMVPRGQGASHGPSLGWHTLGHRSMVRARGRSGRLAGRGGRERVGA
jgi:hypothetical protein